MESELDELARAAQELATAAASSNELKGRAAHGTPQGISFKPRTGRS